MKKIEDYEGFDLLDPTFFDTLMTISHMTWDVSYKIVGEGYLERSGEKYPAPIMRKLYDKDPTNAQALLSNIIIAKYEDNWARLKAAILESDYNPIENYNMLEKESPAETTETITPPETTNTTKVAEVKTTTTPPSTKSETKVAEYEKEIKVPEQTTQTKIPEQKRTITPTLQKTTTERNVYGYNSHTDVPDSKEEVYNARLADGDGVEDIEQGANAGEEKITQGDNSGAENITQGVNPGEETLTILADGVEKVEQGTNPGSNAITVQAPGTNKYTTQKERSLTRTGNIGVTTSQQMLQSEIELRQWAWLDQVYADIDKVIALQTY